MTPLTHLGSHSSLHVLLSVCLYFVVRHSLGCRAADTRALSLAPWLAHNRCHMNERMKAVFGPRARMIYVYFCVV